jgi:hypothetical protein
MATEALTVKNHPTKAQWDEVKTELSGLYGSVYFLIDGYYISANIQKIGQSLKILVYVNGWLKAEWNWRGCEKELKQMPEIARKFYCLKVRNLYSAKEIKSWEKIYGSKAKAKANGVYGKWCSTEWWFSSPAAFIAHIKKHNDSIEIVSYEAYQSALSESKLMSFDSKGGGDGN